MSLGSIVWLEEGKSSWVLPIHCFPLCGWQQAANFNRPFLPFRTPAYCDMIPWLQTLLISPFIGLKLISVVLGVFKAQAHLHTELSAKGWTHVMNRRFFLPHSPAIRGLCSGLTEAQALKYSCKIPIPQGLPVWLQLIMPLVINACISRNAFLLVCKYGYPQGIFKVASSSHSKDFHRFAHCGLLYRFWVMCNPLLLIEVVNKC